MCLLGVGVSVFAYMSDFRPDAAAPVCLIMCQIVVSSQVLSGRDGSLCCCSFVLVRLARPRGAADRALVKRLRCGVVYRSPSIPPSVSFANVLAVFRLFR